MPGRNNIGIGTGINAAHDTGGQQERGASACYDPKKGRTATVGRADKGYHTPTDHKLKKQASANREL